MNEEEPFHDGPERVSLLSMSIRKNKEGKKVKSRRKEGNVGKK